MPHNTAMEEMLPLWTPQGEILNQGISRSEAHRLGHWHPVVHLWIFDPQGWFLLQRRAFDRPTNPGLWDVSCAGHVGFGQTLPEAALRECQEELGLCTDPEGLEFLGRTERQLLQGPVIDREHQNLFKIVLRSRPRQVNFDLKEVAEVRWVPWQEYLKAQEAHAEDHVIQSPAYLRLFRQAVQPWL